MFEEEERMGDRDVPLSSAGSVYRQTGKLLVAIEIQFTRLRSSDVDLSSELICSRSGLADE